jgi:hypothetical protein
MGAMAETMVAFAQPLLDETDGSAIQMQSALMLAQVCWNLALLPEEEREDNLAKMRPTVRGFPPLGRSPHDSAAPRDVPASAPAGTDGQFTRGIATPDAPDLSIASGQAPGDWAQCAVSLQQWEEVQAVLRTMTPSWCGGEFVRESEDRAEQRVPGDGAAPRLNPGVRRVCCRTRRSQSLSSHLKILPTVPSKSPTEISSTGV